MRRLVRLFRDEHGQDLMEYGVLAAFISVAAIATIRIFGPLITPFYGSVVDAVK